MPSLPLATHQQLDELGLVEVPEASSQHVYETIQVVPEVIKVELLLISSHIDTSSSSQPACS
jgi:hypothetical protein